MVVVVYMEKNTKSRFGSGGSFLGNYNRSSDDGGNIRGGSIMVLIVIKEMVIVDIGCYNSSSCDSDTDRSNNIDDYSSND